MYPKEILCIKGAAGQVTIASGQPIQPQETHYRGTLRPERLLDFKTSCQKIPNGRGSKRFLLPFDLFWPSLDVMCHRGKHSGGILQTRIEALMACWTSMGKTKTDQIS